MSEEELPAGWTWTTLGEVADARAGVGFPPRLQGRSTGKYPLAKVGDISRAVARGEFEISHAENYVDESDLAELRARAFPCGTTVFAKIGEAIANNRRAIAGCPLLLDNNAMGLVPREAEIQPRFLFHYMRSVDLYPLAIATTVPSIRKSDIDAIDIPLPPLDEQRRIVAKLDALRARSRRAKAALDAVPVLLDRLRQSILAAAFRGDLTADWREQNPDVEPASELLKRIRIERRKRWEEAELAMLTAKGKRPKDDAWKAKYVEPEPVDETDLPELPDGWCWASLREVAELKGGITKGQKRADGTPLRDVPYLRVANVQRGHLKLDEVTLIAATPDEIADLALRPGDLLFNEGGDRDKLGRGWIWEGQVPECIHQNHVFRGRLLSDDIEPALLSHYTNSMGQAYFLREGSQTTNLASINITKLGALPVPLLPRAEQAVLLALLTRSLTAASGLGNNVTAGLAAVGDLDSAVLAAAFRGELLDGQEAESRSQAPASPR